MTTETITSTTRRCIGSTRFGIEAHEAEVTDFPAQPSQKDGLGRMCKPHWRVYTNALRKAAVARNAEGTQVAVEAEPEPGPEPAAEPIDEAEEPKPRRSRRAKAEQELEIVEAPAG